MAFHDRHRYVADITAQDGRPLGQLPLSIDWDGAVQAVHFGGVRRGQLPPLVRCATATIGPKWDSVRGAPRVSDVRITCHGTDGARASSTIPRTYFRAAVEAAATRLVEQGTLAIGARFYYEICAFPRSAEPAQAKARADRDAFSVSEIAQTLPLVTESLSSRLHDAERQGASIGADGDLPVFIPQHVIAEARKLARQAGDVEWGGVLIGHLCRDTTTPEIFVVVTALIPAQHALAERARLTFTAATWEAARAAIDLRSRAEACVGFAHSHVFWCRNCPDERRRSCPLMQPFFSHDDVALMRAMFPAPFNVALLLSDLGEDELRCNLFGWRDGMIVARDYHLLGAGPLRAGNAATADNPDDVTVPIADPVATCDGPVREAARGSAACRNGLAEPRASNDPQAPQKAR